MGEDPPGVAQQLRAVRGDRVTRSRFLGLDCAGLLERIGRRPDAIDRPGEVDGRRPSGLEDGRGAVEIVPERHPVGGCHADQRRASDREATDRVGDVLGSPQDELPFLGGKGGLIERAKRGAVESERVRARRHVN